MTASGPSQLFYSRTVILRAYDDGSAAGEAEGTDGRGRHLDAPDFVQADADIDVPSLMRPPKG